MNRPLGFCVFLVFGGLFVIFGVWIIGFLSIQTLAYARVLMSGPKKNGIVGRLRHQSVFMTLNFRSVVADGLCRQSVFFPYLVFGFLGFSL